MPKIIDTMNYMLMVRQAYMTDHPAITKVCKQSPYTKDFTNQIFSSDECYAAGRVLIAEAEMSHSCREYVVGFASFRHRVRVNPTTVLYFVGTDREWRKKGVGTTILQYLQTLADKHADGSIEFKVMKDNPAVKWYEELGFKKINGDAYKGMAWVMRGKVSA